MYFLKHVGTELKISKTERQPTRFDPKRQYSKRELRHHLDARGIAGCAVLHLYLAVHDLDAG